MHETKRSNPGKTPIQILHEYGTKTGNLPVYVMEKAEGEAHQPSFVFSVKIGDVNCIGTWTVPPCWVVSHLSLNESFYLNWKSYPDNPKLALQFAVYYLSLLLYCPLCLLLQYTLKYILYMPCFLTKVSHFRHRTVHVQRRGWEAFAKLSVMRWWEIIQSPYLTCSTTCTKLRFLWAYFVLFSSLQG